MRLLPKTRQRTALSHPTRKFPFARKRPLGCMGRLTKTPFMCRFSTAKYRARARNIPHDAGKIVVHRTPLMRRQSSETGNGTLPYNIQRPSLDGHFATMNHHSFTNAPPRGDNARHPRPSLREEARGRRRRGVDPRPARPPQKLRVVPCRKPNVRYDVAR